MSKAMMAVGVVAMGILMLLLVNIIQSYSTGDELDFNLLRDTTEAAMLDAVDISYYQTSGQIRMDKEKFVESFVKRFANNVVGDRYYNIRFYDLNETPPKASVKIGSSTTAVFAGENFDIKNSIDAIIESKYADVNSSKSITNAIDGNSDNKPSWYPSYKNDFNSTGSGSSNGSGSSSTGWTPTEADIMECFNKYKSKFYNRNILKDEDTVVEIMTIYVQILHRKDFDRQARLIVEELTHEMYDRLPKKK